MNAIRIPSGMPYFALAFLTACGPKPWWEDPEATWLTTFGGPGSDVGSAMVELEGGGLFIVGTRNFGFDPGALGDLYFGRTDANGAVSWERVPEEGRSEKGLALVSIGRRELLVGLEHSGPDRRNTDFALMRIDTDGEEVWRREYETPATEHLVGVLEKGSGGFLLFGNEMDPDVPVSGFGAAGNIGWDQRSSPFLISTDPEGRVLWTKSLDTGTNTVAADAASTPDGGAMILSTVTSFPEGNDDLSLMRVDAEGNEVWVETWTERRENGHDLVALADGNYLVVGGSGPADPDRSQSDLLIRKVDAEGNEIWTRVFGDPGMMDWGKKALEAADGGIVVVGSRTRDLAGSPESILLLKLDSEGGLIWEREFRTGTHNMFGGLTQKRDGGFVILGSTRTEAGPFDMFLVRTDGEGNLSQVSSLGASAHSEEGRVQFGTDFQRVLETEHERCSGTGAAAAVLSSNGELWVGTDGISHPGTPVSPAMAFGAGSITKTFVAVLVLQLVDEGLLSLDAPISRWLPEFPNIDGRVTVRELLSHRSGLFDFVEHPRRLPSMLQDLDRLWSPEETIQAFVSEPYQMPGQAFRYSSTNYFLLAMIVERVTGSDLGMVLRHRILEPLALERTFLAVEEPARYPVAHMWYDLDGDGEVEDMEVELGPFPQNAVWSMEWSAGALFSTAEDLVRFSRALFEGDLLEAGSRREMTGPLRQDPGNIFGLGVSVIQSQPPGFVGTGHDGLVGGYSARFVFHEDIGVHIAVLLNQDDFRCKAAISGGLAGVAANRR